MIPAHTLFSKEANARFRIDADCVGRIRYFMDKHEYSHNFIIKRPQSQTDSEPIESSSAQVQSIEECITLFPGLSKNLNEMPFSPAHPPLIGYRYKLRSENVPDNKKFLNDSAFLPIPAKQRSEAAILQKELKNLNRFCQAELYKTSYQELQRCHSRQTPVRVHNFQGRLDPSVDIEKDERDQIPVRITFVLKEGYGNKN